MKSKAFVLVAALLLAAFGNAADLQNSPKQSLPVVRAVYIIPSDHAYRHDYAFALERAIENVRTWYQLQMGGKTFVLPKPVVQVVYSEHSAAWYSTTAAGNYAALWFWFNAIADAFALTGGRFEDPNARWLYYLDADTACGQVAGAAAGVALFPANDLRGLVGEANVPACPFDQPDTAGVCRWVGGTGHELGHTFGLPHPVPCPGGSDDSALMCLGYITYPDTYLTSKDKITLNASPFFVVSKLPPGQARHFACKER
jgi:hypothetical protein